MPSTLQSVQSRSEVLAQALEFNREARHRREVEQQAAAKTENKPREEHANQVFFSQDAQAKLSAEKSNDANRVEAVRIANRTKAAEQESLAVRVERQKHAETETADRQLREARDRIARAKTEAAVKATKENEKLQETIAAGNRKLRAEAADKAVVDRRKAEENRVNASNKVSADRALNARIKVTNDFAAKNDIKTAAENVIEAKKQDSLAAERMRVAKDKTARVRKETDKAIKMYQKVADVGSLKKPPAASP